MLALQRAEVAAHDLRRVWVLPRQACHRDRGNIALTVSLAIDAMGGDRAPEEVVRGAVLVARGGLDVKLHLVGRADEVQEQVTRAEWEGEAIQVVPAEDVIEMSDSPVETLSRKKRSSIAVAMQMLSDGKADAFLSAGNTGACVAAGSLLLRRLKGVKRPGIAAAFHTGTNPVVLIDVGANVHGKPEHLIQYGVMASIYAEEVLDVQDPRVGLLNVGEEDEKGSELVKKTHQLFQNTDINFVGNVEGADLFKTNVEVVVCDGFVGNIVLKVSEGLAENLKVLATDAIRQSIDSLPNKQEVGLAVRRAFADLEKRIDYSEFGGAPLLGVNGNVVIAHGRSDAKAFSNAIRFATKMAMSSLNEKFSEVLQRSS